MGVALDDSIDSILDGRHRIVRKLAGGLCVVALASLALGPRPILAAPTTEPPPPAPSITVEGPVQVEVAAEMIEGELYHGWIHDHARTALERRAPLRAGDRISVRLRGFALDYTIEVRAYRPGEEGQPRWTADKGCKCKLDEMLLEVELLVDRAADELAAVAGAEQRAAREEQRLARERAEAEAEQARLEEENALRSEPYRPARLGFAGAVATGVGGGMLVTGIALAAKGQGAPTGNDLVAPSDLRPPGFALLGVGLGILSTGVTLLVIDVVRCNKDRLECGRREGVFTRATRARARSMTWR
ncbi:MAG: hypothetical protein H6712_11725 [Myxococcales bacterium]|nr:hypothetical protein [Myxococcales bacterium]MCB9714523.1 hypothetical protein [Myxococcales bacterium]